MQLVLSSGFLNGIFLHLASLHWLVIDYYIRYKFALISYNCLSINYPPHVSYRFTIYTTIPRHLSFSESLSYGQWSFAHSAPSVRNTFP